MKKKFLPIEWTKDGWIVIADKDVRITDLYNVRAENELDKSIIEDKFGIVTIDKRINNLDI